MAPPRSTVRFRADAARQLAGRHGLTTVAELAEFFGTTATTYSRVERGVTDAGEVFIAAVLSSPAAQQYPDEVTFDQLFEVTGRQS